MTETLTLARGRMTRPDWRRHLLALVLFVVLVWYTVISPSYTAAPLRAAESEPADAEEREVEARAAGGFAISGVTRGVEPRPEEFEAGDAVDELDWPEIIGDD
ncbi:MAG TPA: hypothetical protein VK421_16710 [Pyrinomonadaceae bacterium]|nr:hypothetical protein [Pyrinomonadaceae bacterium]